MREFHLIDLIPIGLALVLVLALATAPAWGPDVLAFLRWSLAVLRQAIAARAIVRVNVQSSVNDFEDDDELEEGPEGGAITSSGARPGVVPPMVPKASTATCTGDTGFSIDDVSGDLTYKERVAFLAKQVDTKGNPQWSGKKIYALVGGNYGEFVALMRVLRPKDSEPAEEPTILTPIAGRPTKASLYADPEFAYQPPPE